MTTRRMASPNRMLRLHQTHVRGEAKLVGAATDKGVCLPNRNSFAVSPLSA